MSSLRRWPDRRVPFKLIDGLEVVGVIEPSHLFRQVPIKGAPSEDFWGQAAAAYVETLEQDTHVHAEADLIVTETAKEEELGLVGPEMSLRDCNVEWGVGGWRPVPRHLIHQAGKPRLIDDAKHSGHNAHSLLSETIVMPGAICQYA